MVKNNSPYSSNSNNDTYAPSSRSSNSDRNSNINTSNNDNNTKNNSSSVNGRKQSASWWNMVKKYGKPAGVAGIIAGAGLAGGLAGKGRNNASTAVALVKHRVHNRRDGAHATAGLVYYKPAGGGRTRSRMPALPPASSRISTSRRMPALPSASSRISTSRRMPALPSASRQLSQNVNKANAHRRFAKILAAAGKLAGLLTLALAALHKRKRSPPGVDVALSRRIEEVITSGDGLLMRLRNEVSSTRVAKVIKKISNALERVRDASFVFLNLPYNRQYNPSNKEVNLLDSSMKNSLHSLSNINKQLGSSSSNNSRLANMPPGLSGTFIRRSGERQFTHNRTEADSENENEAAWALYAQAIGDKSYKQNYNSNTNFQPKQQPASRQPMQKPASPKKLSQEEVNANFKAFVAKASDIGMDAFIKQAYRYTSLHRKTVFFDSMYKGLSQHKQRSLDIKITKGGTKGEVLFRASIKMDRNAHANTSQKVGDVPAWVYTLVESLERRISDFAKNKQMH